MTRYLRPIFMTVMLALTLVTAACADRGSPSGSSGAGTSSEDNRSRGSSGGLGPSEGGE